MSKKRPKRTTYNGHPEGESADPIVKLLKEFIPCSRKYFAGIGCEPFVNDDGDYQILRKFSGETDIISSNKEGRIKMTVTYIVSPGRNLRPETIAARKGIKLFERNPDEFLSESPDRIRRYCSVAVVIDPPAENRWTVSSYNIRCMRKDKEYFGGNGEEFMHIIVLNLGPSKDSNMKDGAGLLGVIFDKDLTLKETVYALEKRFMLSADLNIMEEIATLHGYLRGYADGKSMAEPAYDFGKAVENIQRGEFIALAEMVMRVHDECGVPIEDPIRVLKLNEEEREKVLAEVEKILKARECFARMPKKKADIPDANRENQESSADEPAA